MIVKSGKITFVSEFPKGYSYSFDSNLYNLDDHLALLGSLKRYSYYLVAPESKSVLGKVSFIVDRHEAISLPNRPFGSFEFNDSIGFDVVYSFIAWVIDQLIALKISNIIIRNYSPIYHQQNQHNIHFALIALGFTVSHHDINHHIPIDHVPFAAKIKLQERRKLIKCQKEGFSFQQEPHNSLANIYSFIRECRREKKVNSLMNYQDLEKSFLAFPDNYLIFSVKKGKQLAATSIVVLVNNQVLYNFLPASLSTFNSYSPMVLLCEALYNYCYKNEIKILDLGISSIENTPQFSLIRFKENIGGAPSVKFTFTKKMD